MKKLFVLGLLVLSLMLSCSKDINEQLVKQELIATILSSPVDESTINENSIKLLWEKNADPSAKYTLYFGNYSVLFESDIIATNLTSLEFTVKDLKPNVTYFWRVDTRNDDAKIISSKVYSFSIANASPSTFALLSPKNMEVINTKEAKLTWKAATDDEAVSYDLAFGDKEVFADSDIIRDVKSLQYIAKDLKPGVKYFWQVTAKDTYGASTKSEIFSFSIDMYGSFTDRDGHVYKTILINGVEWLAENYAFIPEKDSNFLWMIPNADKAAYDNVAENDNYKKYGLLYTLESIMDNLPEGWHLPTDEEWSDVEVFLGMSEEGRTQERYRGTHAPALRKVDPSWKVEATNTSGLGLLPAGKGELGIGTIATPKFEDWAYYLTASTQETVSHSLASWYRTIVGQDDKDEMKGVYRKTDSKKYRMSVRLVKNSK